MFSYSEPSQPPPTGIRRGGPLHVKDLLPGLVAKLVAGAIDPYPPPAAAVRAGTPLLLSLIHI